MTDPRALPDYDAAIQAALSMVHPIVATESIPLDRALGRVLAEDILADRDVPPFHRAQMDGYALRAQDYRPDTPFPVVGHVAAGMPGTIAVPPGSCVSIATGAPLPPDVDAVIQHELSDRQDPVHFSAEDLAPGNAVHPRGADASDGAMVVSSGTVLAPHHLGILAAVGSTTVACVRPPRVTLLTSGDEVRSPDDAVATHEIRNSNQIQLIALFQRMGAAIARAEHLPDDEARTVDTVARALDDSDLVVTVGGVSAGTRDFFPIAFDAANVRRAVKGAAIQPGKPVVVGAAEHHSMVVALPGNPVSALACACLFAWPVLRALQGLPPDLPWRTIKLAESVRPNARRRAFRPARLCADQNSAIVPTWHGSGDLIHTATTDGLVRLPVQSEPVEPGTALSFLPWP